MNDDVVIAGAGPAGSVAGLILARAGVRVRLVDRARFPRPKLCGDMLNPGALALLDSLAVSTAIRRQALGIEGMTVTGPGDATVTSAYGGGLHGAAITRAELDCALLQEAIAAGCSIEEETTSAAPLVDDGRVVGIRIVRHGSEKSIAGRLVIAADGRHSRLAFALGLARFAPWPKRWAFGAYFAGVAGLAALGEMHIRQTGYVGIAPVPHGLANVCVVRELAKEASHAGATDVIDQAIAQEPALRRRFVGAERVGEVTVLGPLAVESRAAGVPGLLLAGDAAGFIDPMTGDGLRFAIRGGQLAAEAALRELETGQSQHVTLAGARRREFRAKWLLNRTLRAMVASERGVRSAARLASVWSAPVEALIALAGDVPVARRFQRP